MTHSYLQGVDYMHSMGVTHGDIKPDNLLLGADGRVRICDLGSAQQCGSQVTFACHTCDRLFVSHTWKCSFPMLSACKRSQEDVPSSFTHVLCGTQDVMIRTVGTPAFFSPEMCDGRPYSARSADVWALGVSLYIFIFGELLHKPFHGLHPQV